MTGVATVFCLLAAGSLVDIDPIGIKNDLKLCGVLCGNTRNVWVLSGFNRKIVASVVGSRKSVTITSEGNYINNPS
jgi:hypothetical protein